MVKKTGDVLVKSGGVLVGGVLICTRQTHILSYVFQGCRTMLLFYSNDYDLCDESKTKCKLILSHLLAHMRWSFELLTSVVCHNNVNI